MTAAARHAPSATAAACGVLVDATDPDLARWWRLHVLLLGMQAAAVVWFVNAGPKPGIPMDRIDALDGHDTLQFSRLRGEALGDSLDDELQSSVTEAARSLGMPIALVSLVLGRTQYFRAHHGLPPDLAIARATDRDVSFCQFVVRDGAEFLVTDAPNDDRIPQDLVKRFGIQSYLGVPLRIDGVVVGALCGLDVRPRQFHDEDRRQLAALGERVSARLGKLAAVPRARPTLVEHAGSVGMAELRNVLLPLLWDADAARIALADLTPLASIANHGALFGQVSRAVGSLAGAAKALDDLHVAIESVNAAAERIRAGLDALNKILVYAATTSLVELVQASNELAHHHTKLIGGVQWPEIVPPRQLALLRSTAISAVTTALSMLASELNGGRHEGGIVASFEVVGTLLTMRFEAGGGPEAEVAARALRAVLATETSIEIRHDGTAMVLELLLVPERSAGEAITAP